MVKEQGEASLACRIAAVRERIAAAARRAGRDPASVRLVAVSKTVDPATIGLAIKLGLADFGENRIQEWLGKAAVLGPGPRWHMIGRLQSNKVRYLSHGIAVLHSIDRPQLLPLLDARWQRWTEALAAVGEGPPFGLLEVNIAGEASKTGLAPAEVSGCLAALRERGTLGGLPVRGLMTVAPYTENPEEVRWVFAALRRLRDEAAAEARMDLPELSMGMSSDFEVAIEEGATMVRIGTAIFGPRS